MGAPPTWYRVVKAARYLRMTPPEVAKMPLFWVEAAEAAQDAEATAEAEHRKRFPQTG